MRLSQQQLINSLYAWWQEHNELDVTTVYPEMRIDTGKHDRWISLWIQSLARTPVRGEQPEITDISLVAHCLSQRQQELTGLNELVDGVSATLSEKTIPVRDFSQEGTPVVGFIKLFEPVIRLSTRSVTSPNMAGIPHVIITWDGWAQRLTS